MINNFDWINGVIIPGKGRGKLLGFPTINLKTEPEITILPGIYTCLSKINNRQYQGLLFYGPRPTFAENTPGLEILIIKKIAGLKPGTKISFKPGKYLRQVIKFDNPRQLTNQIKKDLQHALL